MLRSHGTEGRVQESGRILFDVDDVAPPRVGGRPANVQLVAAIQCGERALQLLTVKELLAGKGLDYPPANVTFKKAPNATAETALPLPLPLETPAVAEATR
jgi:hypothetical protein